VLNIGKLSPGAADYYVGEVATSAEDYYTGKGESPGRWVGSLATSIGLEGRVEPEHFRAVLDGRHPLTGEQLAAPRDRREPGWSGNPAQGSLFDGDLHDVARTASRLRITVGRVRQLLWAGDAAPNEKRSAYLRGRLIPRPDGRGEQWQIERSELERYEAAHLGQKSRPGYDLTLRPPKSVSVLWALGPRPVQQAIRQAHSEAVDVVVAYVETHALYARKRDGKGGRDRVATDGVIAAAFDHRTSRAGDPLLHSHVVTANLTRTVEGRWQAIDGRPLFDHARPAGMLYQAHLRHLLAERLGLEWGEVRKGWAEVEGVPKDVIRAFSKRRDEIEAMVAESGYTSARAHQAATLATRKSKEYGVDPDHLIERWKGEASALGFGPDEVQACLGRVMNADRAGGQTGERVDVASLHALLAGPEGLTKFASTFTRKEVVEAVADEVGDACAAADVERLVDGFLASGMAKGLSPDGAAHEWVWRRGGTKERDVDLARWSTPELLGFEADLERWSTDGLGAPPAAPDARTLGTVLAARPMLSVEQVAMIRALASPDAPSLQPVSGRPGSGKTYATATYVRALVADGIPVIGCALAATAAAELEDSCRFGPLTGREASTVARLLRQLGRKPLATGTVVIIDEASMIGTRDLHRLATHVHAARGSMKLIGDPQQHGAVETGGFFKHLCDLGQAGLIKLEDNNRQKAPEDRQGIEEFRQGLVEAALARYDSNGRIHRAPDARAAYDLMAAHWGEAVAAGGMDPMIAGPNRVRSELNRRARAQMSAVGRLTGATLATDSGLEIQCGDWIVTRRNQAQIRSAGGGWVKNGSIGTVSSVDLEARTMTVDFHREGRIILPAAYLDTPGWVEHGYARTTYGVQGATVERAFYFAGDEASFEEGYVAFTRGRAETRLYLVDGTASTDEETQHKAHAAKATGLDTVANALGRARANPLAHDADPLAAAVHAGYHGWTLDRLRVERARIEAVLTAGPKNVTEQHDEALADREQLLARRQAHSQRPDRGGRREVRRLDGALARLDTRLATLDLTLTERAAYLTDHPDEVAAYPLVRRAELARELEIRADAAVNPPGRLLVALGAPPEQPIARRTWTDAAELVAVHAERYGTSGATGASDAGELALGCRPQALAAALSWDRASEAIRTVQALSNSARDARPEPQVERQVEVLSLLD
jgi:conjugative relaxase-like TrwC/TraI family protein